MTPKAEWKKKQEHPFFCLKKKCRKTAYDTPEYLSPADWEFLRKIVHVLRSGTGVEFHDLLWDRNNPPGQTRNFFYHCLGWPEGHSYCMAEGYTVQTAFPGIVKHQLAKLEKALKVHDRA